MKRADDGLPLFGQRSRELGVRVPPDPNADIDVDSNGEIVMNGKGMSVADHWQSLPPHLIPKRLRDRARGAIGSNATSCYRLGEGPFSASPINDRLILAVDSDRHGLICPSEAMTMESFQSALAGTRLQWEVDEQDRQ